MDYAVYLRDVDDPAEACVGIVDGAGHLPRVGEGIIVERANRKSGYRVVDVHMVMTETASAAHDYGLQVADYQVLVEPKQEILRAFTSLAT